MRKTGRHLKRSDLNWLCREIWRKRRALKREKHLDKIKESAEVENAPKKTQSKHFNWNSIAKDENPESVLTKYFRDLYSISEDQEESTQSERRHWVELWKNMRMDCAGGILISPKKLNNVLKKLKNGKGSPDQITADVLKALPPECLEKLARSLSLMCWGMTFPEDWLCSMTVMAPKVVGATCLTKFRPITGLCAMRKVLGYVWLKSLTPLKYESVQTAFVPKTHADAGLFLLLKAAELSREWQRENCGGTAGREESIRPCGPSSGLQGNEAARCELVLDGFDCCNLEWKSHERAFGNGLVEQSSDEPRTRIGSAGVSGHLYNDHGIGAARPDKELDNTKTVLEAGRFCAGCDLLCGRRGVGRCIDICCRNNVLSEVTEKLKEVGLTVGAQRTHWTSYPKMMDKNITVDGSAVVWEEVCWSLWDRWCAWTGTQDTRSHTDLLKPTYV